MPADSRPHSDSLTTLFYSIYSTIVKLLMRFYDVNSGEIRIDGHPITHISRGALRQNIGMVLQDTWLFHGTIMENIRYGRLDATDEEVIAAAKAARADWFIRSLPGGYQMELNEESTNVSQGQKQLLTIATARHEHGAQRNANGAPRGERHVDGAN